MNTAAIDVGTNSTRLLIADIKDGKLNTLVRTMEIIRLGKDLGQTGVISDVSAKNTIRVLKRYQQQMLDMEVTSYRAVGTKALRTAKNSHWFLELSRRQANIVIEIITGRQEAGLSYRGAIADVDIGRIIKKPPTNAQDWLVLDIGGGSTELIIGSGPEPRKDMSLEIGCVSLTESFDIDYAAMEDYTLNYISNSLKEWRNSKFKASLGLAGTITTLAAIDLELKVYNRDKIHHHILSLDKVKEQYQNLKKMDLAQRKKLAGLHPKRADIIVAGSFILLAIMDLLDLNYIVVSESDILDGIIYSMSDF